MRGRLLKVALILGLVFPGLLLAKGVDLYSLFPNLTLGSDPNGADSVYVACAGITATTLTLQVRVVTDNADPFDALQGVGVELLINTDQPGVTLDTVKANVFAGGFAAGWSDNTRSVDVVGNDPSVYPSQVQIQAVDFSAAIGPGDYLYATLLFNLSSPTNINAGGTTIVSGPATLVTTLSNAYSVAVKAAACGPSVPTLSEWGLILFSLLLLGTVVWYLRRKPGTVSA